MSDAEWRIEIQRRGTTDDGRPRFGCNVEIVPMPQYCESGTCSHYSPAYSKDGVIETVRGILEDIRCGVWKQDEKPAPVPDNTVLEDETGSFAMDDFFDSGTLTAFMAEEVPQ